jgi:hypothetical protein
MTDAGFDSGMVRQWESRVSRWANQGKGREEILYSMTEANWPYEEALRMVNRIGGRQRRKWIFVIIGCALVLFFGLGITYFSITSPGSGGVVYLPISGLVGFIYGLVRLIKLRI